MLRVNEIESYTNRLLIERHRAQLLGMPALQDVSAAGRDTRTTARRASA